MPAGGGDDPIHAEVHHHLAIMVHAMEGQQRREPQACRVTGPEGMLER